MAKRIKIASDQRPFVIAYWDFIESKLFDWNEKRIIIILKKFADSNNQCFPSIKTLCDLSQLSRNTVKKTLKSLEEKKVITIKRRKDKENNRNQSHLYTINDYEEIWNAESVEQIKKTVDIEELQLFELAKKKGYRLEKEMKPSSQPTKVKDDDLIRNQIYKKDNTKKIEKSQEKEKISLNFLREKYDFMKNTQKYPEYEKDFESILGIIHNTMNTDKAVRISGRYTKAEDVKNKLDKLAPDLIIYVIKKFREQTKEIKNPSAYLLTMLYHAQEQYNLDKINQDAQKNQNHETKEKSKNQFCNFEQHSYSKEDMNLIERALLRKSEELIKNKDYKM